MGKWAKSTKENTHILRPNSSKQAFTSVHQKTSLRIFLEILFLVNTHLYIQKHKHQAVAAATTKPKNETKQKQKGNSYKTSRQWNKIKLLN